MSAPIIDHRTATLTLLEEIITSLALLEANPLTKQFAPPFLTIYQNDWTAMALAETSYLVEAYRADALVSAADDALDDFADDLDKVLLRIAKNERSDALYAYYFGKKRPYELKRPILGGQLDIMRTWVEPLKGSTDTDLVPLGVRLETLIAAADQALGKQAAAEEKLKTFRTLGDRKALVDKLNALRKSTSGKLAEMPHANPDARLPGDFASRFYKHAPKRGKSAAKEVTSADLKAQIADSKEQLAALEAQLADVTAREEAEAQAKAQLAADQAALVAAEKTTEEAAAKVAALKAKIGGK